MRFSRTETGERKRLRIEDGGSQDLKGNPRFSASYLRPLFPRENCVRIESLAVGEAAISSKKDMGRDQASTKEVLSLSPGPGFVGLSVGE